MLTATRKRCVEVFACKLLKHATDSHSPLEVFILKSMAVFSFMMFAFQKITFIQQSFLPWGQQEVKNLFQQRGSAWQLVFCKSERLQLSFEIMTYKTVVVGILEMIHKRIQICTLSHSCHLQPPTQVRAPHHLSGYCLCRLGIRK